MFVLLFTIFTFWVVSFGPVAANNEVPLYEESHALLIGTSNYRDGWSILDNVPSEIDSVEVALKEHGFEITRVNDPTSEELKIAFESFISKRGLNPNARLFFLFAGHGYTRKNAMGNSVGYIVPVDAPHPHGDESAFISKALPMQVIDAWAQLIEAKHALFVFDSCFSGSIFTVRSGFVPRAISQNINSPVRQFITSGSANQEVPAVSDFIPLLIKGINGEADLVKDSYITGTELGVYLSSGLNRYSGLQTPQYGKIRKIGLDEGEFIFRAPGDDQKNAETPIGSITPATNSTQSEVVKENSMDDHLVANIPSDQWISIAEDRIKEGDFISVLEEGWTSRLNAGVKGVVEKARNGWSSSMGKGLYGERNAVALLREATLLEKSGVDVIEVFAAKAIGYNVLGDLSAAYSSANHFLQNSAANSPARKVISKLTRRFKKMGVLAGFSLRGLSQWKVHDSTASRDVKWRWRDFCPNYISGNIASSEIGCAFFSGLSSNNMEGSVNSTLTSQEFDLSNYNAPRLSFILGGGSGDIRKSELKIQVSNKSTDGWQTIRSWSLEEGILPSSFELPLTDNHSQRTRIRFVVKFKRSNSTPGIGLMNLLVFDA
ncbi:MAG: hypothetical protein GKR95_10575 [Gammaproteobacteria bacterium]|nr:hypothetical protein [Gammaproteobacteria bacterium]